MRFRSGFGFQKKLKSESAADPKKIAGYPLRIHSVPCSAGIFVPEVSGVLIFRISTLL